MFIQTCHPMEVPSHLPNIVAQSVLLAICISLLLFVQDEQIFKEKPHLLYIYSFIVVITLEVKDQSQTLDRFSIWILRPLTWVSSFITPHWWNKAVPMERFFLNLQCEQKLWIHMTW